MAGSFGDFWENEILDHIFGVGSYTAPTNIYIGLSTSTPTDSGTNVTEPVGNNYARVTVANSGTNWDTASGGATANKTAITFNTASGSWGTVTYFVAYNNSSGGDFLFYGDLSESKAIGSGDTPKFNIGDLDITLS